MKNIALAVAAMAFAPLALAAEGQGDETQPTMLELKQSIDALGVRVGRVENRVGGLATTAGTHTAKLNSLATTVGTLSSTIAANHTTIVGKFAPQVAVVTAELEASGSSYIAALKLLGDSSIQGFRRRVPDGGSQTQRCRPAPTFSRCISRTAATCCATAAFR